MKICACPIRNICPITHQSGHESVENRFEHAQQSLYHQEHYSGDVKFGNKENGVLQASWQPRIGVGEGRPLKTSDSMSAYGPGLRP
jgi:hypothetical protein